MTRICHLALIACLSTTAAAAGMPVQKVGDQCPSGYLHDHINSQFCVPMRNTRAPETIVARKCPSGWKSDHGVYCQR